MRLAPLLNSQHVFLAAEVVAALRRGPPLGLACHLADVAASWFRAVVLMSAVTVVGIEQLPAANGTCAVVVPSCGPLTAPAARPQVSAPRRPATCLTEQEENGRRSFSNEEGGKKIQGEENSMFNPADDMQFRPGCDTLRTSLSHQAKSEKATRAKPKLSISDANVF